MTSRQAADYLKISMVTMYRWTARKRLPGYKIRSRLRFFKEELDLWVMGQIFVCPSCGQIYRRIDTALSGKELDEVIQRALADGHGLVFLSKGADINNPSVEVECGNCDWKAGE